jgi:hypothetical protein
MRCLENIIALTELNFTAPLANYSSDTVTVCSMFQILVLQLQTLYLGELEKAKYFGGIYSFYLSWVHCYWKPVGPHKSEDLFSCLLALKA